MDAKYWVPAIEATVLLFVCLYMVCKFADRTRTSCFVMSITVLGWYMAFSMIFAIPLDIYIVSSRICKQI